MNIKKTMVLGSLLLGFAGAGFIGTQKAGARTIYPVPESAKIKFEVTGNVQDGYTLGEWSNAVRKSDSGGHEKIEAG